MCYNMGPGKYLSWDELTGLYARYNRFIHPGNTELKLSEIWTDAISKCVNGWDTWATREVIVAQIQ